MLANLLYHDEKQTSHIFMTESSFATWSKVPTKLGRHYSPSLAPETGKQGSYLPYIQRDGSKRRLSGP